MEHNCRKDNRLDNYDYSSNGMYFITMCTKDRVQYLAEIKYNEKYFDDFDGFIIQNVGDGVFDVPLIKLTEYGEILNDQINEMNSVYKNSKIIKYVIMPDHLHMIVELFDDDRIMCGTSRTPSPTNATLPSVISTLKRFVNKRVGFNIWQRSYHDRIIRNEAEFCQIWQYIDNNPINWANGIYDQNSWR